MFGKRFPIEHILNSHKRTTTGRRRRTRRNAPGSQFVSFERLEERTLLTNPLTSIPLLNSNPGAPVTVYLDFDGNSEDWDTGRAGNEDTPVYDIDGDLTTFSDEELSRIEEIWARVSEDFSPFTVNVTTIDPGTYNNLETIKASIGGSGPFITPAAGGVAWLNAFTNGQSNTVFAFSDNLNNGAAKAVALTISHEVGHAVGLNHHSEYDASGNMIQEYDPGTAEIGPLMGAPFNSARDVWVNAPGNVNFQSIQDDVALITRDVNGPFDFRDDDFGNTFATAADIPLEAGSSTRLTQNGILETEDDIDMFRVETDSGDVAFSVDGINLITQFNTTNAGTNVDLVLSLYDVDGNLVLEDSPANSLSASITTSVTRGTYFVSVSGNDYSSIGQYTIVADVIPLPTTPIMVTPSDIIAEGSPTFSWTQAAAADHYELQVDNVTTGENAFIYNPNVAGTTLVSPLSLREGDYRARVRSVTTLGSFSEWSDYLSFTVDIPTPAIPEFITPSDFQILVDSAVKFDWTGDDNGVTYNLWVQQVSNADGVLTGDRVVFVNGLTESEYAHHRPFTDGVYKAWVQAENSVGDTSLWSVEARNFTVDTPAPGRAVLTSPIGSITDTTPTFTFSNVGIRYELWVNNRSTGESRVIFEPNLTELTYTPTVPLEQGSYRAWVRAFDVNGATSDIANGYSLPVDFTIDVARPGTLQVVGPTGNPVTDSTPDIEWTAATNANSYQLWVTSLTDRKRVVYEVVDAADGTTFTVQDPLPDGQYKAFVRAMNDAGEPGPWSSGFVFTVDDLAPERSQITSPAVNAVGTHGNPLPTFAWTASSNVARYDLWVNNKTTGVNQVIRQRNLTTNSFTTSTALVDGDTYVAWVRAINGTGESLGWSEPYTFTISVPTPGTPIVISPEGTAVDSNGNPTNTPLFVWTNQNTVSYQLFILNLTDNSNIRVNINDVFVDSTTNLVNYQIEQALAAGTYQFWVRAVNSSGDAGGWSQPKSFVIDQVASIEGHQSPLQFNDSAESDAAAVDQPDAVVVQQPVMMLAAVESSEPMTDGDKQVTAEPEVDQHIESVMAQWALNDWWTEPVSDVAVGAATSVEVVAEATTEESDGLYAAAAIPLLAVTSVNKSGRKNKDED